MTGKTTALRKLLAEEAFIHMPVAYDALGGRLIESTGFKSAYVGGFVTGGARCTSEPLLTLDEQVRVAGDVARAVTIPTLADAGAGFGEPLHTMRTVREFIHAGIAGVHIEDQLFPKRAHYHKYVAHVIPRKEFADKIRLACRQRDQSDKDFVIVARSDSCRFEGLDEAVGRGNLAAEHGADMGMIFPRDLGELLLAPTPSKIPLVYVAAAAPVTTGRLRAPPNSPIWATRWRSTHCSPYWSAFISTSARSRSCSRPEILPASA